MTLQIVLTILTGACTLAALLASFAAQRSMAAAETIARSLEVSIGQTNSRIASLEEEQLAFEKRFKAFSGRFYRDLRGSQPERDPATVDFVNGRSDGIIDPELQALIDFQSAPIAAPK